MTITHLFCLLACAGHLVLWRCDRNLTYLAGGRFDFRCLQDNDRLSAVLGGTPLKQPMGATWGVRSDGGVFGVSGAVPMDGAVFQAVGWADAGRVRAVLPAWHGASCVLRGVGVVLSVAGSDRGGTRGRRGFFQRHLCRHIPLIFGFAGLCAVSARGRGQRYHQLAPLNLSVQHAAPIFTAVPLAHCGYDEPGQRGNVFGAICFDLRCGISKRHSTPRQRGHCPRFAAGGGRCRSCGWRLSS